MSAVTLRPRAQNDLDKIWDHTVERWGDAQAERYVSDIWHGIGLLADDARRGRECPEIRAGYRKYQVASHIIFYRAAEGGIEVVRILHKRMDFARHFPAASSGQL